MNTQTMEYIIAIADLQSVSKAAEHCYLTQSALSQQVRRAEKELGMPLFQYRKGGMQLTEAGIIFINGCRRILHAEKQLGEKMEKECIRYLGADTSEKGELCL